MSLRKQGLSLCTDYLEKFPKDSVSKEELGVQTVWQRVKEAKSQCQCVQTLEEQASINIPFSQLTPCNSQCTHTSLLPAVSFWSLLEWWMMTRQGYDTIGWGTTSSRAIIFRCQGKTFRTLQSPVFLFIISTFLQPRTLV